MTTIQENKIEQFVSAYREGIAAWEKAGRIIVDILDESPDGAKAITDAYPQITTAILSLFERIGRGSLLPALACDSSPGASALKRLPLGVQKAHVSEPVSLVVETDTGVDVMLVDVRNLTREQSEQVFSRDHIRTEGEQRAWMVDRQSRLRSAKRSKDAHNPSWHIDRGRVTFDAGVSLTAGELAMIISQIAK
jgi:hypothetical protein